MPESLLQFLDQLTQLNEIANGPDETEMWQRIRRVDELLAPYGYRLVRFDDMACYVPVKHVYMFHA
jgi:hypothetical protein